MPVETLSHSTLPTARLFYLKSLFTQDKKYLIITDSADDMHLLRHFASDIIGRPVKEINQVAELWQLESSVSEIYMLSPGVLEVDGNLRHLEQHSLLSIKRGTDMTPEMLIEDLIKVGYEHSLYPGELGTYRREGGTITITDHLSGNTILIEWFDTEIDSIVEISADGAERHFREAITIKYRGETLSHIRSHEGVVNPHLLSLIKESGAETILIGLDFHDQIEDLRAISSIHLSDFHRDDAESLAVEPLQIGHIDELRAILQSHPETRIFSKYESTIRDFLEFHRLSHISYTPVHRIGLESFASPWCRVIADDTLGQIFVKKRSQKSIAKHLDLLLHLNPGDLVVHREHGIARFDAIIQKSLSTTDGIPFEREYMELHYAGGDKLFVPLTEIYRVSKYLGHPDVELTKLTGKEWERTMEKTSEEIEIIARDIIETSARRTLARGFSFANFRDSEETFRQAFPYEHTSDQLTAIHEILRDMESESPMDRLLSGDVGFGKTEVAMNAIYKAVLSGTQVAVISPLLVLADEHYETFTERLGAFGVRIGVMTRMNTQREIETTLKQLKSGEIDVIVGTHRLLSDDVQFRRLGLLVIDEEHKFGVTHKEKIKKIRSGVDILSLSATPIPRSLNLALSGLKKISLLTTPPQAKKPIETIITRWSETILADAIHREIDRGGQVIILHNRIRGMESLEKEIMSILDGKTDHGTDRGGSGEETVGVRGKTASRGAKRPSFSSPDGFGTFATKSTDNKSQDREHMGSTKIIVTHGQMPGEQIEERIHAFKKREYDILLTTTIIENGVNFLSANTIIIIDPEEFGLASLHQLRGRVGRRDVQGYCYLMYRKPELTPDEKKRLITIANNTHLGAGFEIAMRDMELRGAGDVLGIKQSGRSKDVGLTLYFRLLEERIEELKNIRKRRILPKIDLEISYHIPDDLFVSDTDKLNFFREIESLETLEELDEIEGSMVAPTGSGGVLSPLFVILRTRLILSDYRVVRVSKMGIHYVIDFAEDMTADEMRRFLDRFDTQKRMALLSLRKLRVETRYWHSPESFLTEFLY